MPPKIKRIPPTPRPSASVLLVSPLAKGVVTPDGFEYKVCLIKRHASLSLPNMTVFPGGNLDEGDSVTAATLAKVAPTSQRNEDLDALALKVCAIREAFEETGILLLGSRGSDVLESVPETTLASWRKRVYSRADCFLEVYTELSEMMGQEFTCPVNSLSRWSRWVTPVGPKKRWNTSFYLHVMPPYRQDSSSLSNSGLDTPKLVVDNTETSFAEWTTPRQALDGQFKEGKTAFMPPQAWLLAELAQLPTLSALQKHAKVRIVEPFLPRLLPLPDDPDRSAFILPGDQDYEATKLTPSTVGKRLHRTYAKTFQTENGSKESILQGLIRRNVSGREDVQEGQLFDFAAPAAPSKL